MRSRKSTKNGAATKMKRMPKWKRRVDEYRLSELVKLTFATDKDLDDATALVWGGKLTGVPFDLDPNGPSLILPKASVPFFAREGLAFIEKSPCPPYRT